MAKHETHYRGYGIEVQRNGAGYNVWVRPLRPDLPIMWTNSFKTGSGNEEQAVAEAVRRINRLLAPWASY
jgi:hypothetical protein